MNTGGFWMGWLAAYWLLCYCCSCFLKRRVSLVCASSCWRRLVLSTSPVLGSVDVPVSNGPVGSDQNCPSKSSWMDWYPGGIASLDVNAFLPLAVSNSDFCFFLVGDLLCRRLN